MPGLSDASTSNSVAPVFNLGFNYAFDRHWFAGISASYMPRSLTATLHSKHMTSGGDVPITSETDIQLDPIVTNLKIGYVF
ncbi:OmpW family outer membrane protein [Burkholderia sp. Ac-20353]|uniref:OmpW family outer membrane protein n=1 Tax=Burkholderia sp. Ac-20353 TaxID=2703894 RepID=UPI002402D420|nr:OmpW family outer membrane protein [Burkholderia sp. Ac-20353]